MRKIIFIGLLASTLSVGCQKSPEEAFRRINIAQKNASNPKTYEDWHAKQDQFENTIDTNWQLALKSKNICSALSQRSDEDLLELMPQIFLTTAAHLSCREEILDRVHKLRLSRRQDLLGSHTRFGLTPCSDSELIVPDTLPTEIKVIDTTGGPRFVTGDLGRCQIAFTFDDGPHPIYTQEILNTLKTAKVSAVFFQMGGRVKKYSHISQKVADMGHTLANHTWTHQNMPKMSFEDGKIEIEKGFNALFQIDRPIAPFFRFPYGAFTKDLRDYLVSNDVSEFFWNMDTLDWKFKDPEVLYANVVQEIEREKRGIILFHDVQAQTSEILPALLQDLRANGYKTVHMVPKKYIEGSTVFWSN